MLRTGKQNVSKITEINLVEGNQTLKTGRNLLTCPARKESEQCVQFNLKTIFCSMSMLNRLRSPLYIYALFLNSTRS